MLRPVRLKRLTAFVHSNGLADFVLALDSAGCVDVDEPSLVEPAEVDLGPLKDRLSELESEASRRELEEPGPTFAGDTAGIAPRSADDVELLAELSAVKGRLRMAEAVATFGRVGEVYVLEGWIPERDLDLLEEVEEATGGLCSFHLDKPELEGVPPTLLDNPDFVGIPELFVRTYGLPSYFELDPTPIIALTFPLIFGVMYGDLGHAAVLFLVAAGAARSDRFPRGSSHFLVSLTVSSAFFGAMYGEVFGLHYFEAIWFDRLEGIFFLVRISLVVGILHVVLALLLSCLNSWLNRRPHRSFYRGMWMVFYALWIPVVFGDPGLLKGIGYVLAAILATGFAVSLLEGGSAFVGLIEIFRELFYSLMHVSSYIRVAAVSVTHAVFSSLLIKVLGPTPASFAAWLVLTFLLIIVVETFLASLQTLRLHWDEWFYNFYEGEGREFIALALEEGVSGDGPVL